MDLEFGFLWRVERMGGNVGGLLIISGGIFKTFCLSWGCSWGEMWHVAVSVHLSIRCMASDAGYAAQCLSPVYRSIWFQLVFFSTVSCFWVLRKINIIIVIIIIIIIIVNINFGCSSISW